MADLEPMEDSSAISDYATRLRSAQKMYCKPSTDCPALKVASEFVNRRRHAFSQKTG